VLGPIEKGMIVEYGAVCWDRFLFIEWRAGPIFVYGAVCWDR